jgi:hypothetical protein
MDKLMVFRKTWEYLFWLRPAIAGFTKIHKYSLGVEMQANAMQLIRLIISANYAETKGDLIQSALIENEVQRVYLRLAFEYKQISRRRFEFSEAKLDEIGHLLRGWSRQQNR